MPLWMRIITLGSQLEVISELIEKKDNDGLDHLLSSPIRSAVSDADMTDSKRIYSSLKIMTKMLKTLDEKSVSVHDKGEAALCYLEKDEKITERYLNAKHHFETRFSNWEIFFEHILVNHMFFSVFPYQDRPEDMRSEVTALCAIYAFMRFFTIGCMADKNEESELIDTLAAAFRLIDHTDFDSKDRGEQVIGQVLLLPQDIGEIGITTPQRPLWTAFPTS